MREWTREERYVALDRNDTEKLRALHDRISQSIWRCSYHVQTVTGLLGDTNGFSYFDGRWHLFYQWFPYGAVHGLKHWYHTSSEDLLTWKNEGLGIGPGEYYDDKGVFSGSGFPEGDVLYLPYTGNHRDENWVRYPYQLLAWMDKDGVIHKQEEPLCGPIAGYTEHQRDPKMFFHEGYYYFLIGVQNEEKKGRFLLMRSKEIRSGWQIYGELNVRGYDDFGFMVECPDLEKVGDQWLLLFSPQGLEPKGDEFRNVYNNTYFIGQMDFEHCEFIPNGPFKELDRGLDFYAAQCAGQNIWPNRAVLEAWFGVSDYIYEPTAEEDYSGLQTMARILTIENGALKQRPADDWKKLEETLCGEYDKDAETEMPRSAVIEVESNNSAVSLDLYGAEDHPGFTVEYDPQSRYLTIERGHMENQINTKYGTDRRVHLENGLSQMVIFADASSVEIFVNDGEYVLSSRIFPTLQEHLFRLKQSDGKTALYKAARTVQDDFVL